MAILTLRASKGAPLSVSEVDGNFTNLNNALGAAGSNTIPTPTGTGVPVLSTSPTLVSPVLGTPTSGNLTNCTITAGNIAGAISPSTSGNLLTSNGTSWLSTPPSVSLLNIAVAPGTTGNVMTSNGTSWISSGLSASLIAAITPGTTGNVLTSNGTSWISSGLSASLIAAITPGTSGNVLTSNGTSWISSALTSASISAAILPGTSGNVLTSNGVTWVSTSPAVSLPSQSGNGGKYLKTDGSSASWTDVLTGVKLGTYQENVVALTANTSSTILDMSLGSVFVVTIAANTTFSFTNVPTGYNLTSFTVITVNDATAGRAVTWPASVTWAGGLLPARTTTANKSDAWAFFTINAGTTVIGSLSVASY